MAQEDAQYHLDMVWVVQLTYLLLGASPSLLSLSTLSGSLGAIPNTGKKNFVLVAPWVDQDVHQLIQHQQNPGFGTEAQTHRWYRFSTDQIQTPTNPTDSTDSTDLQTLQM
ncbi:hypothetical protein EDD16DRAFT_1528767 [Pisolithus croceorrhizus]|nr:hypothetical protein EDD16DRAFT_1528767 [Pisolithus croceorrhizus]